MFEVENFEIEGLKLIKPKIFSDNRGDFIEFFSDKVFREKVENVDFVQDNLSSSSRGVIRGLHHQWRKPQGKLVSVMSGEVLDVVVDIRIGSRTYGKWAACKLSDENKHQLYIPPGLAHGFQVLSTTAKFYYKCTDYYDPGYETTILFNDPRLGIEWEQIDQIVSEKDMNGITLDTYERL